MQSIFIHLTLLSYTAFMQWLEGHLLTCPSRRYLHIQCPGCGLQRSYIALLKGDLVSSLQLYPAAIPMVFLLGFAALHIRYQFTHGAVVIKYLQLSTAILIAVFYIYKILHHQITA